MAESEASLAPVVARLRAAGCVFAEDEARILADAAADPAALEQLVLRRIAGEPLEYIVGAAEFGGLMVTVLPGVFVPRQRSLLLVDVAVEGAPPNGMAVDLCCGSGALGLLFATRLPDTELLAADIDPRAVACARLNLGHRGQVVSGDLFDPLPAALCGNVDVLMCNAPYVPTAAMATMPPEARDFEPAGTLDGGPDGLDLLRRVAAGAPAWLAPAGRLIMEVGDSQVDSAARVFDDAGLVPSVHADPERGATVIVGVGGGAVRKV
jgi:release factor glutamine methyltransferase